MGKKDNKYHIDNFVVHFPFSEIFRKIVKDYITDKKTIYELFHFKDDLDIVKET